MREMESKVAAIAASDPALVQRPSSPARTTRGGEPAVTGADPVDLRLVIEEDQASGSYVYKTVNRLTGEIIQQLPRAEVLRLRDELRYAPGDVVRTEA